MTKWIIIVLVVLVVAIQFVPVNRSNPQASAQLALEDDVAAILKRSCFDCHSNNTVWPWYSKIAPVSFFVAHHVEEGRDELNFSEWGSYSSEKQMKKIDELLEEVQEGKMPLKSYVLIHKNAALSQSDKDVLKSWTQSLLEPQLNPEVSVGMSEQ